MLDHFKKDVNTVLLILSFMYVATVSSNRIGNEDDDDQTLTTSSATTVHEDCHD
jgi:hypothetical protein